MSTPNGSNKHARQDAAHFREQYGPWALVAGASKGLGAAFAEQLAARGLNLALVARRADALEALAEEIALRHGVEVRTLVIDLSDADAPARITEQVADLEIGLLVYNAAYSAIGGFLEIPLEDHLREIGTNVRAPLALAYLLGQHMAPRRRGGMVLMSSLSAAQGSALISNYAATKAYNVVLAEGIWEELRRQGIDVLVSCPAAVSTPGFNQSIGEEQLVGEQSKGEKSMREGAEKEQGRKLDSGQGRESRSSVSAMSPEDVARETIESLGKRPLIIPGRANRAAAFVMQRLLPRPAAVRLMGRVLWGMYGARKNGARSSG